MEVEYSDRARNGDKGDSNKSTGSFGFLIPTVHTYSYYSVLVLYSPYDKDAKHCFNFVPSNVLLHARLMAPV